MATVKPFPEVELPEQKCQSNGALFPAVLSPNHTTRDASVIQLSAFEDSIRDHKPWFESLLKERGVILFRGFPVTSPSDFNNVVEAFDFPEHSYVGGRVTRTKVVGRVYTANECPAHQGIPFHHEMAYVPDFPSKLFFFCEEEPGEGGETPIVLSHIVYEKMYEKHPDFVAQLEEHGLRYITITGEEDDPSLFNGRGWKSIFKTDDKNVAKERAAKMGTKLEWIGNGVKLITDPVPAVRFNDEIKRKTWFNSLGVSYSGPGSDKNQNRNSSVELGNGDPVDDDVVNDFVKILEENCAVIPWKKGDVMLIDNLMVLHGRRPLLKPPRRILASLCK